MCRGNEDSRQGQSEKCTTCLKGKMVNERSRIPDRRATEVLELVHCDLARPVTPTAKGGYRYARVFKDDYSDLTTVYLIKQKSEAYCCLQKFLSDVTPYGTVRRLRSDSGGEFMSMCFQEVLLSRGIKHETSAPDSPHQNGTAERGWRTLFEMARCQCIPANVPKFLWTYSVRAAA